MAETDVAADEPIGFNYHPKRDPEYYSTWVERERRRRRDRLLALGIDPALVPPPRAATEQELAEIPPHPIKSVRMDPDGQVTFVPHVLTVRRFGSTPSARPREQRARRAGSSQRGSPSSRSSDDDPPGLTPLQIAIGVVADLFDLLDRGERETFASVLCEIAARESARYLDDEDLPS